MKCFILTIVTLLLYFCSLANAQDIAESDAIFDKGDKIVSENYTGDVWISRLFLKPGFLVANITLGPSSRNNWHCHPGAEQLMMVTFGEGYYQIEGQPAHRVKKGDIVNIPAGAVHWQGAAEGSYFVHLTITDEVGGEHVKWGSPVSDEEYRQAIY